jgi:hypothetical protein
MLEDRSASPEPGEPTMPPLDGSCTPNELHFSAGPGALPHCFLKEVQWTIGALLQNAVIYLRD